MFVFNAGEDVCSLPPDGGDCRALLIKWYYDPTEKECKEFDYGGCDGNANRFKRKEECEARCKPKST